MKKIVKKQTYSNLIIDIASLIEQGRKVAVRYVNTTLVATYWLVGRRIVEFEQKGKERAEYGEALLKKMSVDLTKRFGKGFGYVNLNLMRQFFLNYSTQRILQTPSEESSINQKSQTLSSQLQISHTLSAKFTLSWSHYCLLMRIDEPFKREFYEAECIRGEFGGHNT